MQQREQQGLAVLPEPSGFRLRIEYREDFAEDVRPQSRNRLLQPADDFELAAFDVYFQDGKLVQRLKETVAAKDGHWLLTPVSVGRPESVDDAGGRIHRVALRQERHNRISVR